MRVFSSLLTAALFAAAFVPASHAHADTVAMSTADCQRLVTHIPAPDVEYKPGVDVHGKAVVPADLNGGSTIALPQSIDINIGVNLARRLTPQATQTAPANATTSANATASTNAASPFSGVRPYAYAPLGTVTIKGNDVYWNGTMIGAADEAELITACRQGLNAAGVVPTTKPIPPPK